MVKSNEIQIGDGVIISFNNEDENYVIRNIIGSDKYVSQILISPIGTPNQIFKIYPLGGVWKVQGEESTPYQISFIPGPILDIQTLLQDEVLNYLDIHTQTSYLVSFKNYLNFNEYINFIKYFYD